MLDHDGVIVAKPRLHITLVDLAGATPRSFGGIGCLFDGPRTQWRFKSSNVLRLGGIDLCDERDVRAVEQAVARLIAKVGPIQVAAHLEQLAPQHCGFGSKTSLLLSLLAGINEFVGLGLSPKDIQMLSGRGGASGVGCHAFFQGGAVWDGGHTRQSRDFLPSGAREGHDVPPLLARWAMPTAWHVFTILPDDVPIFAEAEQSFFSRHTPTRASETLETLAAICHGVIPAIQLRDLALLRDSLNTIHAVGFKHREVAERRDVTKALLSALQDCPMVAAGMSSLGPLIYAIADRSNRSADFAVLRIADTYGAVVHGPHAFSNSGYEYRTLTCD